MVAKELVQNAKIVDASTKIAEGAVVKLVPNAACAAEQLGNNPANASAGSACYLQCRGVLEERLRSLRFATNTWEPNMLSPDVVHFECTPWHDEPLAWDVAQEASGAAAGVGAGTGGGAGPEATGGASAAAAILSLSLVVVFAKDRHASSMVVTGVRRAHLAARSLAQLRLGVGLVAAGSPSWAGGYEMEQAWCFCSIDGRLQNRVSISRAGLRTTLLYRCNFMLNLEHHPILNRLLGDMAGKDGRTELEALLRMRWKIVNLFAGRLVVRSAGEAATIPVVPHVFLRSTGEGSMQWVDAEGHVQPLSRVPQTGPRLAKLRTTCGRHYLPDTDYAITCSGKGSGFVGALRVADGDVTGGLSQLRLTAHGRGYTKTGAKCHVGQPEDQPGALECKIAADELNDDKGIVGFELGGDEVEVDSTFGGDRLLTRGHHLRAGLYSVEISRGWSSPFSLDELLSWMARVPAVSASQRRAWVPADSPNLRPWLVLDSACAEGVCGRAKATAEFGCNILCTAGQCEMRNCDLQYTCKPITRACCSGSNLLTLAVITRRAYVMRACNVQCWQR